MCIYYDKFYYLYDNLKINYKYETQKRDIGVKRNALVKSSKNKICVMMDDDDIYFPSYIHQVLLFDHQSRTG